MVQVGWALGLLGMGKRVLGPLEKKQLGRGEGRKGDAHPTKCQNKCQTENGVVGANQNRPRRILVGLSVFLTRESSFF